MKKTLIALAVLGSAAGVAHAQSNVTIYGIVDTGYIYQSGHDLRMGENVNNRLGFRGSEDLGGGLKATFELEQRFDLFNGAQRGGKDFDGAANVGLAGKDWGRIRFGRINELTTETIRKFDPFYQYGVASMFESTQRNARIDNTARYDSPKWSGFSFGASYSLGQNTDTDSGGKAPGTAGAAGADNDGYGINLSYNNGPWMATANWSRVADSNDSYVWNAGVSYKFANALRLMLAYENTHDKGWTGGGNSRNNTMTGKSKQQNWVAGLEWDIGPGQLDAAVNYLRVKDTPSWNGTDDALKYSLGYTYNLSKRTAVYGFVAYEDYDSKAMGQMYREMDRDSVTSVQVGMTHKF